jgi:glyoxylase-like metal-dependent hydrolase (beta-lactamase superfamily II)
MTGSGNWTYLQAGPRPLLVEAGVGHAGHLDAVVGAGPVVAAVVVVTLAHAVHVSGAPALRERAPSARFLKVPWPESDAA